MPELWGLLKYNDQACSHEEMMSKWKSYSRTIRQRIKCVFQDSFSAKSHQQLWWSSWWISLPFGSFERNPFSSTSTRAWWFSEKWQKRLYREGQVQWTWLPTLNISLLSSYTFERVQEDSDKVWKFQRYELIAEYHGRPLFFPPLIFISHILLFVRWIWQLCRCGNPPSGSSMSKLSFMFLGKCPPTPPLN